MTSSIANKLKIAMLVPPWLPVPPGRYGGTESVIDTLVRALDKMGHEVVLLARGESTCPVEIHPLIPASESAGPIAIELAWVTEAYQQMSEMPDIDVIHDNTLTGAILGPKLVDTPIVVTCHFPFSQELLPALKTATVGSNLVAISQSQADRLPIPTTVIHHGIDVSDIPKGNGKGDYLAFIGRLNADKGADRAARLACENGWNLKIAARLTEPAEIAFFTKEVEPYLGDGVEYIGEVGGDEKWEFLGNARALLNPIRWSEPFGLVMIEALACGTPAIVTPNGAAPEIIRDGISGFVCESDEEIINAYAHLGDISRDQCRKEVEASFSAERMAADYASLYDRVNAL